MGIFDDIMVNAKSAANAVGKKAEQIVDFSKLKYAESGIENEITQKLKDLGGFVYDSMTAGEMDKTLLEKKTAELTELYHQLEMTREMIAASKNKKCCKACGTLNDKDSLFCGKCGAKLEEDRKKAEPKAESAAAPAQPEEAPKQQAPQAQPDLQVLEQPQDPQKEE